MTSKSKRTIGMKLLAIAVLASSVVILPVATASAAPKQAIAYFGTEVGPGSLGGEFNLPGGIAVNSSGAGPANRGDIYVVDVENNRIQRFAQNDNGTPENPYDDKYEFLSAWGADADGSTAGGSNYEICTVAASCKAGVRTGGNGTLAGDGSLGRPSGIAVDQDTGNVYVTDPESHRVDVYQGSGIFQRSFGFDVIESGPDSNGTGFEICVAANGDVCKAGTGGPGIGQLGNDGAAFGIAVSPADGNPAAGTVYVADSGGNRRIDTYALDGSSPSSIGSAANFPQYFSPVSVAVDSRGIVYAANHGNSEVGEQIVRYDSENANGGGVGFLAPISIPTVPPSRIGVSGLQVDADSDGAGPETDVLYVATGTTSGDTTQLIRQFGPLNRPGLTTPPTVEDEDHGANLEATSISGLGLDESTGRLFVSSSLNTGGPWNHQEGPNGVYVLDKAGGVASASLDSLSDITDHSVVLHGTVNPNGPPDASYHAEYSLDGVTWKSEASVTLGSQESPQGVSVPIDPVGGLEPNALYHVRLVATRPFNPSVASGELTFTTLARAPLAETAGTPLRTTTTADLAGRVDPDNSPTSFHFEYGAEGPCSSSPCASTSASPAGSGNVYELVSARASELEANTTYHYRLVAESAAPGSPVFGEDRTVRTRADDAPLSHGHFPGPPGTDRAWEQVNLPDTGGNPVSGIGAFSEDGEKVFYSVNGGTPASTMGGLASVFYAHRGASSWITEPILPPREDLVGSQVVLQAGPPDLSTFVIANYNNTTARRDYWRLSPGGQPTKLAEFALPQESGLSFWISEDTSRVVTGVKGGDLDPAYPSASSRENFYDVGSGALHLVSLLPGNTVSPCGIAGASQATSVTSAADWVSSDGQRVFFPSKGDDCSDRSQLYMRELGPETTQLLSAPALSGKLCSAAFIKSTSEAVFFWTQTRLTAEDTNPGGCAAGTDGDVYRYALADGELKCVTCVAPGLDADVVINESDPSGPGSSMAVSEDGSRVYFHSPKRLLPGADANGGTYRVDVATGGLRWIGAGVEISGLWSAGTAMTRDGTIVIFPSKDPRLNPLGEGALQNAGTRQYYRYDDRDGSLVCVSCPVDGAPPPADNATGGGDSTSVGFGKQPLSADGSTLAFVTTTPLVAADQNTPGSEGDPRGGSDVYEWRDGRLLLVSDGLTDWPVGAGEPALGGVDPSGHDIFFTEAAQLTPDALDGYNRLYDARIGGGFEFPLPPKPCPLEVCQGTPKGVPEQQVPGTAPFSGPGNVPPHNRAHRKKHSHKKRHHKTNSRKNHNRRTGR